MTTKNSRNMAVLMIAALATSGGGSAAHAALQEQTTVSVASQDADPFASSNQTQGQNQRIIIQRLEPDGGPAGARETTWLGLAVEESPEVLSSQLGLKAGEGLTVNFISPDSPAAKADFQKNDVLVELDGQMLVDPEQLRKLVQMHAEGDTIKLTFFRGGHKQTVAVKLGKRAAAKELFRDDSRMPGGLPKMEFRLQDLEGQLKGMNESLARAGLNKSNITFTVQRTLDQTSKAIQDAMRQASVSLTSLTNVDLELKALAGKGLDVDKDATVTVRTKNNETRTVVKSDDEGTIILEAGDNKHLTARDKDGKTLFDGNINTPAEQSQVPPAVWEKVKPILNSDEH